MELNAAAEEVQRRYDAEPEGPRRTYDRFQVRPIDAMDPAKGWKVTGRRHDDHTTEDDLAR